MANEKIKKFVLDLLDESLYEVPLSIATIINLTRKFLPVSEGEIEAAIDELLAEGFLTLGIAYGYDCGLISTKKTIAKKPLVLQPIALAT